jgi:hypothetical protein
VTCSGRAEHATQNPGDDNSDNQRQRRFDDKLAAAEENTKADLVHDNLAGESVG